MRPIAALILVTPLLACFTDGGNTAVVSSASSSGGVEPTSAGPGTSTSDAASTADAPPTGETGTTQAATTGAVDQCPPAPECTPGVVETGALCEGCGVLRRTCQADCSWTPMTCEEDLDSCAYWVLPAGERAWQRMPVEPAAEFAPKETVLAAIALAPQQRIYVLTDSSYHVLSTVERSWVGAGPRGALFPEFDGLPLVQASEIAAEPPNTVVNVLAGDEVFAYTYLNGAFVFDKAVPCCGPNWELPAAPPVPAAVRDGWGKLGDGEGWIPGDVQALCPEQMPAELFGYNVAIGDGWVYPQDVGYCFDFYAPIPFDQFAPFTYPGRPDNGLIGGAGWVDGLWIFRGQ